MTIEEYASRIRDITSSRLAPSEKRAALELLAQEIDGCAWQPWARRRAQLVATHARTTASAYPEGGLEALEALARKGLLRRA